MTGNENDARTAFLDWKVGSFDYLFSDEGCSRYVFFIHGVIYKVNRMSEGIWDANEDEYLNAQRMAPLLPKGVRIPAMDIYDIDGNSVLAMEYISGTPTGECSDSWTGLGCECDGLCLPDTLISTLDGIGWDDPSWGNAISTANDVYLVDVA